MKVARVLGEVVATVRHPHLSDMKLMLAQPVTPGGGTAAVVSIAVDCVQAGPGDLVMLLDEGNGAAQAVLRPRGPARNVIVGVVDAWGEHGTGSA